VLSPNNSPPMMVLEVLSDSAVQEFRNPCSNHDNVGLIIWAKAQDI